MTAKEKAALKALARGRTKAELKALFALIRAKNDRALFAAIAPPKKKKAAKRADPLVKDLETTLRPILGPAAEKGELLIEHMAKKHRFAAQGSPRGLADAAKRLRQHCSDAQIRAGAKSLLSEVASLYSSRESVV